MKLTEGNIKYDVNYKIVSGKSKNPEKLDINDTIMISKLNSSKNYTVFRFTRADPKRPNKIHNKVWYFDTINEVKNLLSPFKFIIDREFAEKRIKKLKSEILDIYEKYEIGPYRVIESTKKTTKLCNKIIKALKLYKKGHKMPFKVKINEENEMIESKNYKIEITDDFQEDSKMEKPKPKPGMTLKENLLPQSPKTEVKSNTIESDIINSDIIITLNSKNNRLFNTSVYLNNGKGINQMGYIQSINLKADLNNIQLIAEFPPESSNQAEKKIKEYSSSLNKKGCKVIRKPV